MAAWGFAHSWEILSALEGKIRIPKRPCNVRFSRSIFWSDRFSYFLYDLLSDFSSEFLSISCPFFCPFFFRFLVLIFVRFFVLFFVRTSDIRHRTSHIEIGHRASDVGHHTSDSEHRTSNRISNDGRRTSDMGHYYVTTQWSWWFKQSDWFAISDSSTVFTFWRVDNVWARSFSNFF